MQFRRHVADASAGLSLDSDEDTIIITDAALWTFSIPTVLNFPLAAGVWQYDFETTDAAGFVRTYFGGTLTVERDVTR